MMLNSEQLDRVLRMPRKALPDDSKSRGLLVIVVETGVAPADIDATTDGICADEVPRLLLDAFDHMTKNTTQIVELPGPSEKEQ